MHAFVENLDGQVAAGHAAQGRGQPHLVVIAAAGIEADDQRRLADALGQVVDVVRQVVAARFLAGFDHDHAARMRNLLRLQGHDRGQRAEDRIAVVGAAAPVQPIALDDRLPRPEVLRPAGHFRLLVEMAVEQDAVVTLAGNIDEDQRRAPFQAHHFELHARNRLRACPGFHQGDGLVHVAVLRPVGIEHRRLVRDANVVDQLRHDLFVPDLADEAADCV